MRFLIVLLMAITLSACTRSGNSLLQGFAPKKDAPSETQPMVTSSTEVAVWLPWWDWDAALESVNNTPSITTISPFTYVIGEEGTISNKKSLPVALKGKYTIIPSISHDLEAPRITEIMEDPFLRAAHIQQVVEIAENYDGVELDYENLPKEYKDTYSEFVEEVAKEVHAKNKLLALALHAKTNDIVVYAGAGSLDYARLCKAADICRVMAYDYHYSGSPTPGAVTPIYWLKEVIDYSQKHIPNEKLVLALPLYGYEWSTPKKGVSKTQKQIKELLQSKGDQIEQQFEEKSQTPFLSYGTTQLWYDNEQSLKVKVDYAKSKGIYQFAFWRIGADELLLNKIF